MKRKISPIEILTTTLLLLVCGYVMYFTGQIESNPRLPYSWWRMSEYPQYPQQIMGDTNHYQYFMVMSNELNNPRVITVKPPVSTSPNKN